MSKKRNHDCGKVKFKGNIKICTLPFTHTSWILELIRFDNIRVHIKFCPYCGVKLP